MMTAVGESHRVAVPSRWPRGLARTARHVGSKMSLAEFCAWQPDADGWKYEWNHGQVESGETGLKNTERGIVDRLQRVVYLTAAAQAGGGLFAETDCWLERIGKLRRPDLAFFNAEQILQSSRGEHPVPGWVVEIVSPYDQGNKLEIKILEYFAAGVQVVWYLYPLLRMVKIYTSPQQVTIGLGQDRCSAAPVLPDLNLNVADVFGEGT